MGSRTTDHTEKASLWRPVARTLGILAAVAAVLPSGVYQGGAVRTEAEREFLARNPDAMPFRSDYTLGWQSSPLVRRFSEATLTVDGAAGVTVRRSSGLNIDLLSWSMASLTVGILLLWAARTGRAGAGGSPDAEPGSVLSRGDS
jgi:hypothetical protein